MNKKKFLFWSLQILLSLGVITGFAVSHRVIEKTDNIILESTMLYKITTQLGSRNTDQDIKIHELNDSLRRHKKLLDYQNKKIKQLAAKLELLDLTIDNEKKRWGIVRKVRKAITQSLPSGGYKSFGCRAPSPTDILRIAGYVVDYSIQYGVDIPLTLAIITQESAFCQAAVSKAGAYGLMQLMPSTAEEISKEIGINLKYHRSKDNIRMGTYYISSMLLMFRGNLELAVRAYNSGPNFVKKVQAGEISRYYSETNKYWEAVSKYKEQYELMGLK